jgi:hypothetical protein
MTDVNTTRYAQVLQALADHPTGPEAIPHLLHLASILSEQHDTSCWLASDLVPTLLSVLRSLPTTGPPVHATHVCAAAVAVLDNILNGLWYPDVASQFHSTVASDDAACLALVRCGLSCPEAAESLPSEQSTARGDPMLRPSAATHPGHPFWSPLTCCMSLLCAIASVPGVPASQGLPPCVKDAITPELMERVMRVGIQHPCGRAPVQSPCEAACQAVHSWQPVYLVMYFHSYSDATLTTHDPLQYFVRGWHLHGCQDYEQ